ncbi:MAG: hypothetical protein PHR77_12495, partial [Kiritimatiellae bacterium]|nr:hypothetical protein [Kiritimatiellia bacterium]
IQVPGCWEAQGVGEPGMSVCWDPVWDAGPRVLRHVFMGHGWYRKTVKIPESWKNQKVWLKVGGVRSQGWFWINGKRAACVDNYCGTYKYDITDLVQPGGDAVITVKVRNDSPCRKGLFSWCHRFGGLYRDVELEATPATRIDYAWVRGDFDKKLAIVNTTVCRNDLQTSTKEANLQIDLKTTDGLAAGKGTQKVVFDPNNNTAEVRCEIPLTEFQAWTPESPKLYYAEIVLRDGNKPVHGWMERFGVRKFEVRGDRFYFNNQPFFVRGYGDDLIYPMTLISPASREEHRKNLEVARKSGFAYVRHHTHCELPEFFDAADEIGILVQPELPYYGEYPTEAFTFNPMRDLEELIIHYRRYVSLATYCMGNEGYLGSPVDHELYQLVKKLDPDRLVLHQDGGGNKPGNCDFRNGPVKPWIPGSFTSDVPFTAHEYLNLAVKVDPRLESRFTGIMPPPVTMETYKKSLAIAGLSQTWGDACLEAQHALQKYYQKQGLEQARLDPSCDGYIFWTIVDVMLPQGNAVTAQGLYNGFWEPKTMGFTPEQFRVFNDQTALLIKFDVKDPIAVSGEKFGFQCWISHFGNSVLNKAGLSWVIRNNDTILAKGDLPGQDIEIGNVKELGRTEIVVPPLTKPVAAVLEAKLSGTDIANRWNIWLFPKRTQQNGEGIAVSKSLMPALAPLYSGLVVAGESGAEKAEILISSIGSADVKPALSAGKRVILINGAKGRSNVGLGWWSMGAQVGTAFARHPALGDFPHEGYLSPLAFRILKTGQKMPCMQGLLQDEMFVVGEGLDSYFLYGTEARIEQGRVLITFGLDLLSGYPEGTCILDGLIRYARSDAFNPKGKTDLFTLSVAPNGWQRTLVTGDSGHEHLPLGCLQIDVARAMKGKNELVWETRPVPEKVHDQQVFSVSWQGGMGYFAEPQGSFALYVNDEKILDIPVISEQSKTWFNTDKTVSLKYERDLSRPEMGLMTLSLPSSKMMPGKPLRLKVTAGDSKSRRWFGVCQML